MLPRGIEHANPSETRVFAALCRIGRETGRGFASMREIAGAVGWGRSSHYVQRCLRNLARLGLARQGGAGYYTATPGLEFVPAGRVGTTGAKRGAARRSAE